MFIHVEGSEEISGIDAEGNYTESKSNKMEAEKVVSKLHVMKQMLLLQVYLVCNRNLLSKIF